MFQEALRERSRLPLWPLPQPQPRLLRRPLRRLQRRAAYNVDVDGWRLLRRADPTTGAVVHGVQSALCGFGADRLWCLFHTQVQVSDIGILQCQA